MNINELKSLYKWGKTIGIHNLAQLKWFKWRYEILTNSELLNLLYKFRCDKIAR